MVPRSFDSTRFSKAKYTEIANRTYCSNCVETNDRKRIALQHQNSGTPKTPALKSREFGDSPFLELCPQPLQRRQLESFIDCN